MTLNEWLFTDSNKVQSRPENKRASHGDRGELKLILYWHHVSAAARKQLMQIQTSRSQVQSSKIAVNSLNFATGDFFI